MKKLTALFTLAAFIFSSCSSLITPHSDDSYNASKLSDAKTKEYLSRSDSKEVLQLPNRTLLVDRNNDEYQGHVFEPEEELQVVDNRSDDYQGVPLRELASDHKSAEERAEIMDKLKEKEQKRDEARDRDQPITILAEDKAAANSSAPYAQANTKSYGHVKKSANPVDVYKIIKIEVVAGDSLSKLSKEFYNSLFSWNRILEQNPQIQNENLIYVGDKLKIPLTKGEYDSYQKLAEGSSKDENLSYSPDFDSSQSLDNSIEDQELALAIAALGEDQGPPEDQEREPSSVGDKAHLVYFLLALFTMFILGLVFFGKREEDEHSV